MNLGKIARIVRLREELRKRRNELEGLVVQYIELNQEARIIAEACAPRPHGSYATLQNCEEQGLGGA
jgi:hypothetical protein